MKFTPVIFVMLRRQHRQIFSRSFVFLFFIFFSICFSLLFYRFWTSSPFIFLSLFPPLQLIFFLLFLLLSFLFILFLASSSYFHDILILNWYLNDISSHFSAFTIFFSFLPIQIIIIVSFFFVLFFYFSFIIFLEFLYSIFITVLHLRLKVFSIVFPFTFFYTLNTLPQFSFIVHSLILIWLSFIIFPSVKYFIVSPSVIFRPLFQDYILIFLSSFW